MSALLKLRRWFAITLMAVILAAVILWSALRAYVLDALLEMFGDALVALIERLEFWAEPATNQGDTP